VETVWADEVTPDSGVNRVVAAYRPMVERLATRTIATFAEPLTREGNQYPLGSLIADAQRASAPGIDVALMNNGGIRRDMTAGPATYGDLFELQPFGNSMLRVAVTGAQLKQVMERVLVTGRPTFHASGVRVRYDSRKPAGQRVLEIRKLNGTPIRPHGRYTLGVTDFLQGGGDGMAMLRNLPFRPAGKSDLESLTAYLGSFKTAVKGPTDRRFIDVAP
jgi:5'-nucleotidase